MLLAPGSTISPVGAHNHHGSNVELMFMGMFPLTEALRILARGRAAAIHHCGRQDSPHGYIGRAEVSRVHREG